MRNLEAEVVAMEALRQALLGDILEMKREREKALVARTLLGHVQNLLGYCLSLYCIYRCGWVCGAAPGGVCVCVPWVVGVWQQKVCRAGRGAQGSRHNCMRSVAVVVAGSGVRWTWVSAEAPDLGFNCCAPQDVCQRAGAGLW